MNFAFTKPWGCTHVARFPVFPVRSPAPPYAGLFSLDCFPTINSLSPLCEANDERAAYLTPVAISDFLRVTADTVAWQNHRRAVVRFAVKLHSPKGTKRFCGINGIATDLGPICRISVILDLLPAPISDGFLV